MDPTHQAHAVHPLTLSDDPLADDLSQALEAAPERHLAVCADSGRLLWANAAMRDWLGLGGGSVDGALTPLAALPSRLGCPDDDGWRQFRGSSRRAALVRRLTPDPDAGPESVGSMLECLSLWLRDDRGPQLLVRVRPLPRDEQAFLQNSAHALQAGHAFEGMPEGSGIVRLDCPTGQVRVAFADQGFARLLGEAAPLGRRPSDWAAYGLSAFDGLLLLAAVLTQSPALFVLRVHQPGGAARRWRLGVSPRECASGTPDAEACALLTLHPKDKIAPPPRRLAREVDRPDEAMLCLNARGDLLFADPAWQQVLGHTVDASLGRPLLDFVLPQARANCQPLLHPVFSGAAGSTRQELPFVHADGSTLWVELRLWRDLDVAGVFGATLFDVSAQVRARRIRSIQATALENTVNGVVITSCEEPGDKVVYINSGFTRLSGYSVEETLGRNCNMLQGPGTDPAARQRLRQAIEAREPITEVLLNYRKDGTPFWNRVEISPIRDPLSGVVTHFFGLQTDVTLSRQAEEAALRRATELERLFRFSPLGIVASDDQQRLLVVSPAFGRLTGLGVEDLAGRPLSELLLAARALAHEPGLPPAWPEPGKTTHWTLTHPVRRVLELSATEPDNGAGEQLVFVRDVTAELELNRMKTQFLATAAHELRAPMGSIRGFAELMLLREFPREQQREMLDTVHRQSLRMNNLLSDLLDLTKLEAQGEDAFAVGPVLLNDVAERALKLVLLPGDAREIRVHGQETPHWVQGHGAKLEQVLINLLSNALKYSPGGGAVSLGLEAVPERPDWLCVSVRDEGLGLSPQQQAQLFTRFFRADPSNGIPGTGLGLVIVKELVERMGGRIGVRSALGQGATFSVWLRREEAQTA